MKDGLTAHVMLKNEERWVWYSIMSVIDYVDRLVIFDTGSSDSTADIVRSISSNQRYKDKIYFEEVGEIDSSQFHSLRQRQIEMTDTSWFLVLDGDEIWYESDIQKLRNLVLADHCQYELIAIKFHNAVGDIYHYKSFESESYRIKDVVGSITIRAYKMTIPGLACSGNYGVEGYVDDTKLPVQNVEDRIIVMPGCYFHTSFLQRSRSLRQDWEIPYRRPKVFAKREHRVSDDFRFPEAFFLGRPDKIISPFKTERLKYFFFRTMYLAWMFYERVRKLTIGRLRGPSEE